MKRWIGLLICLVVVCLGACSKPAEPISAPPGPVGATGTAPPARTQPPALVGPVVLGVLAGQGGVPSGVRQGMDQVAPANQAQIVEIASASDAKAKRCRAILLVGGDDSETAMAAAAALPVIVVGGPGGAKAAAILAGDASLKQLSGAQAAELGRVAVETACSVLAKDGGLERERPLASISP